MARLAHLSDLHLGASASHASNVAGMVDMLLEQEIEHVVVTGDITHSGRSRQLEQFYELFAPLDREGRVTVVPGNHDRCGDDVSAALSGGRRVSVKRRDDLYLVRVDSTAEHNKTFFRSHGELCTRMLDQISEALEAAPRNVTVALLLHHHLIPMPVEHVFEWFSNAFGWPHAEELPLGHELLKRARGRCDLVLHGHRHVPRQFIVDGDGARPLRIYNAGSTSELSACRVFDLGAELHEPQWLHSFAAPRPSPYTRPQPALAVQLL